jgi:hypothetical protein
VCNQAAHRNQTAAENAYGEAAAATRRRENAEEHLLPAFRFLAKLFDRNDKNKKRVQPLDSVSTPPGGGLHVVCA